MIASLHCFVTDVKSIQLRDDLDEWLLAQQSFAPAFPSRSVSFSRFADVVFQKEFEKCSYDGDGGQLTDLVPARCKRCFDDVRCKLERKAVDQPA